MRNFNPLCFVLRFSRIFGVFPVEITADRTFAISKKYQFWSAMVLVAFYLIELTKFRAHSALLSKESMNSYELLLTISSVFSNIITLLNFFHTFVSMNEVVHLINILLNIYKKLEVQMLSLSKAKLIVIIIVLPSLANSAHILYTFTHEYPQSITFFLYVCKSMSYTCVSWQFCCLCFVTTLVISRINEKIIDPKTKLHEMDELRIMFSSLCEICRRLDALAGFSTLFYLLNLSIHFQIDLFVVLKNTYNAIFGIKAEMWGFWGLWNKLAFTIFSTFKVLSYIWSITKLSLEVIV
jgi:hypothetical protein